MKSETRRIRSSNLRGSVDAVPCASVFRPDALRGLLWIYAVVVFYATLLPFQFQNHRHARTILERVAWNPLRLGPGTPTPLFDVLANVGFFIPFGMLAWATGHASRTGRRTTDPAVWASLAVGAGLSIAVEIAQIWTSARTPATSDVLANTTGALMGALVAAGLAALLGWSKARAMGAWIRAEPLSIPLLGLIVLATVHALVPFDLIWRPRQWLHAVGEIRFWPWGEHGDGVLSLTPLLLSALLAGVADRAFGRLEAGKARLGRALGLALGVVAVVALGQVGIASRTTSGFEMLEGVCGALSGVALSRALETRWSGVRLARRIALLYALSLAVTTLYPIESPLDPGAVRQRVASWFPRAALPEVASRTTVHELLNVLFLYIPFGYLVAASLSHTRSRRVAPFLVSVVLISSAVALVLGGLRAVLPGSDASPGHAIPATLGSLVGAFVWLWRSDHDAHVDAHANGQADVQASVHADAHA